LILFLVLTVHCWLEDVGEQRKILLSENAALHETVILLKEEIAEGNLTWIQLLETYELARTGQGSLSSRSGFTPEMYEAVWRELEVSDLMGTGEAFARAEENYRVNGVFLAAVALHESNGGKSKIAQEKRNLFGLNAVDDNPHKAMSFTTKNESIDFAASLISNHYLDRSGRFYQGENIEAIGVHYASDPAWCQKVMAHMFLIIDMLFQKLAEGSCVLLQSKR